LFVHIAVYSGDDHLLQWTLSLIAVRTVSHHAAITMWIGDCTLMCHHASQCGLVVNMWIIVLFG